jgi:8-amino-7-oxononanoate synthase
MRRMQSLDAFAQDALGRLDAQSLRRRLIPTERTGGAQAMRDGRPLISFSCNDYFGLAQDPRLKAAAIAAVERYGTGAAASRLVTGDHPLSAALEARLAERCGKPAARLFGSGYLANISIVPALVGADDLILLDALSHACMLGGARLSGARTLRFRHNDADHLAELLASERPLARRCLIMTERVFSMDGDLAPLGRIAALAEAHDAWLMADGAHDLGASPGAAAPLEMGTLSKGLGSYGGYLAASEPVADLTISRARGFVYSTGLPPASVAAALAALDVLEAEPWRRTRPLELAQRFTQVVGLAAAQSAVVPMIVGDAGQALALSARLQREGFLVVAIRPPTVPPGMSRLRFSFSAAHSEADVDRLAASVIGSRAAA